MPRPVRRRRELVAVARGPAELEAAWAQLEATPPRHAGRARGHAAAARSRPPEAARSRMERKGARWAGAARPRAATAATSMAGEGGAGREGGDAAPRADPAVRELQGCVQATSRLPPPPWPPDELVAGRTELSPPPCAPVAAFRPASQLRRTPLPPAT